MDLSLILTAEILEEAGPLILEAKLLYLAVEFYSLDEGNTLLPVFS